MELVVKTGDVLLLFVDGLNHLLVSRRVVQGTLLVVPELLLEAFSLLPGGLLLLVRHLLDDALVLILLIFNVLFFLLQEFLVCLK